MTIAAGFYYDKGILLCADTQFSAPSIKFYQPKLTSTISVGAKDVHVGFAMSGTDGYMQTAVASCEKALCEVDEVKELNEHFVREILENALVEVYSKHLYSHPRYGYPDGPSVDLIIGVLTSDSEPMLFSTQETTVSPVTDEFRCVGSGGLIAAQALRPLVGPSASRSLKKTLLLATHGLKVAKDSDLYCGGTSEFAVINGSGFERRVPGLNIEYLESYSQVFQGIMNDLFFAAVDIENEAECISKALRTVKSRSLEIWNEQRAAREKRERLLQMLSPDEPLDDQANAPPTQ